MGNHNNEHDSHGKGGAGHGTVKEYVTGLGLSIVLTVIPFGYVMSGAELSFFALGLIGVCAVAQLLVQAIFFLHMNSSSEQAWNLSTGIYTLIMFVVVIIGSLWIFTHLHHNMLMGH